MDAVMNEASSQTQYTTNHLIEALVEANACNATERNRHIFRQALHALVMLAKAEKLLEIKRDTATALGIKFDSQA
jgi:ribosomal protein L17